VIASRRTRIRARLSDCAPADMIRALLAEEAEAAGDPEPIWNAARVPNVPRRSRRRPAASAHRAAGHLHLRHAGGRPTRSSMGWSAASIWRSASWRRSAGTLRS
jgi:hypothetical protein